jgi:glycosyltransferase involved in cell wall biosynthesis
MMWAPFDLAITRLKDGVRYSQPVREGIGQMLGLLARLTQDPSKRLSLLCRAVSLCDRREKWQPLMTRLHQAADDATALTWTAALRHRSRLPAIVKSRPELTRSVILKAPGPNGEKGVLLHYFEYNLARLLLALTDEELNWLAERFHIILAASWTPTDYALLGLAAARLPGGLWIQPATHGERARLTCFHEKLRCLPGLACDWVDPVFYQPKVWTERSVDILMVANWGDFKRHWEFFLALRLMPKDLRVVLIGQKEGRNTRTSLLKLARNIGVPQTLDVRESLPIEEVTRLQCDSKVSLVLSRREGGCVAMVESLFAGCAIAMREGASIGSAAHINERTGAFLRPGHIAADLMDLLKQGAVLDPAGWANENVSCQRTLMAVEEALHLHEQAAGRPWTQGLAQVHWRPHPVLSHPAERAALTPCYDELHQRFPQLFPADLMSRSFS